jgi:exodeoxyribonuclease V alpha subunit
MNKAKYGCSNINSIIRNLKNPPSKNKKEIDLKVRILRENDVVINVKNNYDLGIANGEMGVIKEINPDEKTAIIEFEYESKTIELKRSELLHIRHGYVVSCHKFQGSEADIVIAPLLMAHFPLLYRSMIYTLMTRGKSLVCVLGDRKALNIAVNNIKDNNRQTSLIELLQMKNQT